MIRHIYDDEENELTLPELILTGILLLGVIVITWVQYG